MCSKMHEGTSLVVQWLWILLAMQGTWVQFLGGELRSHMQLSPDFTPPEPTHQSLRVCAQPWKSLPATAKTWHSQINKYLKNAWLHWGVLIYQGKFRIMQRRDTEELFFFPNQCTWSCFLLSRYQLYLFKSRDHDFIVFMVQGTSSRSFHTPHLAVTHNTWLFGTCLHWNDTVHLACVLSWALTEATLYYTQWTPSLQPSGNTGFQRQSQGVTVLCQWWLWRQPFPRGGSNAWMITSLWSCSMCWFYSIR